MSTLLIISSIAIAILSWWLIKKERRKARVAELEYKVIKRLEERAHSLDWADNESRTIPVEKREKIGSLSFEQLKEALQKGDVTASDVLTTYYGLALKAHRKTNCITLFIKESRKWAEEWDERVKNGEKKPPLFGIPISIKECNKVKGYDQTRGYAACIGSPATEDALLVVQLKELGCIPFVQTNVPTSLLSYTCGNSIYGWTENPHKKGRTPGGSSGGESAIIGAGGSIIGIGGDVGGSVRIPAHYTGTAAIKPSHLRLSSAGVIGSVPGRPLINASDGPMAPTIKTCADILKHLWSSHWISDRDPYVPPVTWRDELFDAKKTYRIGYYTDDGWFTPTPGCSRMVLEAKKILEAKGHTVVPFHPPDVPEVYRLFVRSVCVDGGKYLMDKIENDIPPPVFLTALMPLRIPILLQRLAGVIANLLGYSRIHKLSQSMALTTSELRESYAAIEAYRARFIKEMQKANVDILLCPANVMPAPPHEGPIHLSCGVSYTAIFNLLDFGAGVCKTGQWSEEDEKNLENYPTTDVWYKMAKNYSKDSIGIPLGVQVAAPPYWEEAVLKVLVDIENGTNN